MTSVEYMHFVRALVVTDFSLFLSLSIFFLTKIKKNCDSHIHSVHADM